MNAFHEQLAQISLAEILPKIEEPGSATSRRARPLLEAHLRSMGAV